MDKLKIEALVSLHTAVKREFTEKDLEKFQIIMRDAFQDTDFAFTLSIIPLDKDGCSTKCIHQFINHSRSIYASQKED